MFGQKILSMSTIQEIESAIVRLSPAEREAIRDWLDELVEEQLEVSDAFKAKIDRARQELARGEISRLQPNPPAEGLELRLGPQVVKHGKVGQRVNRPVVGHAKRALEQTYAGGRLKIENLKSEIWAVT